MPQTSRHISDDTSPDITKAVLVWGSQLTIDHHTALQANPDAPVLIIEHRSIARKFKYHKQKLLFVFASMRAYADELRDAGRTVHYVELGQTTTGSWFEELSRLCKDQRIDSVAVMRQNDKTPQRKLEAWAKQTGMRLEVTPNDQFLTRGVDFEDWAKDQKRLQMEQFYRWQRKRLGILMQENGKPEGGSWNYDAQNRQPLPAKTTLPELTFPKPTKHVEAIAKIIKKDFADHPGKLDTLWLPTTRQQSRDWLRQFITERFRNFGVYEDAMRAGEPFLFHSCLSALLNIGLLHASEVVQAALDAKDIPLPAREGFIRQIIGWREFMFGLYHYKPDDWIDDNALNHRRKLPDYWWFTDDAPEPPLADVLARVERYGYAHHIERLMVLGNYMLISGYKPQYVYDWFMTMFVDAYEWVMVPNIIGMGQYADGGVDNGGFATKPYISGSNYLQKMGKWWPSAAAAKDSDWTPLYWDFLSRHEDKLRNNFRLQPLYRQVDKRK